MRWAGCCLHADVVLDVGDGTTLTEAHDLAHEAEYRLTAALPRLGSALVHAYPARDPA